jgi:hypothetical protein
MSQAGQGRRSAGIGRPYSQDLRSRIGVAVKGKFLERGGADAFKRRIAPDE